MYDTVKHNGMDQPFLISRKLRFLVGVVTTSTESYFLLEVWKQLKKNMTKNSTTSSYHIARRVGHQGEKNATGLNISKDRRLFKCKKTTLVSTFNCRTLSSIGRTGELTSIAQEQNIDVICI